MSVGYAVRFPAPHLYTGENEKLHQCTSYFYDI